MEKQYTEMIDYLKKVSNVLNRKKGGLETLFLGITNTWFPNEIVISVENHNKWGEILNHPLYRYFQNTNQDLYSNMRTTAHVSFNTKHEHYITFTFSHPQPSPYYEMSEDAIELIMEEF